MLACRRCHCRLDTIAVLCQTTTTTSNKKKTNECEKNTLPRWKWKKCMTKKKHQNENSRRKCHRWDATWAAHGAEEEKTVFFFARSSRSIVIRYDTKHIIKYKNSWNGMLNHYGGSDDNGELKMQQESIQYSLSFAAAAIGVAQLANRLLNEHVLLDAGSLRMNRTFGWCIYYSSRFSFYCLFCFVRRSSKFAFICEQEDAPRHCWLRNCSKLGIANENRWDARLCHRRNRNHRRCTGAPIINLSMRRFCWFAGKSDGNRR